MKILAQPDIEGVKRKNIIDMALVFTAMMRIVTKKSKAKIHARLEEFFSRLALVRTSSDYEQQHLSFCEWFTHEIRTAEKKHKDKVRLSQPPSYGQAAKVLDIAAKVYVYYCALPTAEIAQRIVPFLHGAVDTKILKDLKESDHATTPQFGRLRLKRSIKTVIGVYSRS